MIIKICKRCGRELPLDKFGINNGYIRSFCKDCNNKYHREYRHAKRMQAKSMVKDREEKENNVVSIDDRKEE